MAQHSRRPLPYASNRAFGLFVSLLLAASITASVAATTPDPYLEPGFPLQLFGSTGAYSGSGLNVVVGNIDEDPTLEIAVTAVAGGPLYIWNADGSPQPGWPFSYATGAAYAALGEMLPSRAGLEIMVGYYASMPNPIYAYDGSANLLPGWPQAGSGDYIGIPATFVDIDNDGTDEVWVPSGGSLYAYRADGTQLADWQPSGPVGQTPAVADLDGDGSIEIVSTGNGLNNRTALYALRQDGTIVQGFPVNLDLYYVFPTAVIGDVDGDNQLEIVTQARQAFLIISANGQIERTLPTGSIWGEVSKPALADMDGDGFPEIIAQDGGLLYVWRGDGSVLPGWPVPWSIQSFQQAPIVGDIDGDTWPDIVTRHQMSGIVYSSTVRAYDRFGQLLSGFPREFPVSSEFASAIADIDLDGRNELIVSGGVCCESRDAVWAYDFQGAGPYGRVEWGQFMGGPKHQGVYVPPTCPNGDFIDVPSDHTFRPYVQCLATRGILGGYGNCTFRPNNGITRGQLAKIVSNAAGFSEPVQGQFFADVPPDNPFYAYIQRLGARGQISGYPCGGPNEPCDPQNRSYFRPNGSTTRAQIAKIVANARGLNDPPGDQLFTDVPIDSPFYSYIQRLARLGSISGYPCGSDGEPCDPQNRPYFRPDNSATRGQTAKIVANTFFPNCNLATPQP